MSGSGLILLALITQIFVEVRVIEQDVDDALTHLWRVEGLGAHQLMGIESADDRIQQRLVQIR